MINAERTMKIDLGSGELCLRHGQPIRVTRAPGLRVSCVAGMIWITVAGEAADVFLAPGQSYRIKDQGLALIESIGEGRVRLEIAPPASGASGAGRWLAWLARRAARTDCGVRPAPFSRTGRAASAPGFPV
jgi:hypothetical protein